MVIVVYICKLDGRIYPTIYVKWTVITTQFLKKKVFCLNLIVVTPWFMIVNLGHIATQFFSVLM